jgi:hypothetical protein
MLGNADGLLSSTNGIAFSLSARAASILAVHGLKVEAGVSGEVTSSLIFFAFVILQ